MERLIHKTDKNTPKYKEYNQNFPKLPSYFRRSGIMEVIGIFSSFDTRFNLYLEEKPLKTKQLEELKIKLSKKYDLKTENKIKDLEKSIYYEYNCPTFNFYPETFPVLYKNNMSEINKNDLLTLIDSSIVDFPTAFGPTISVAVVSVFSSMFFKPLKFLILMLSF